MPAPYSPIITPADLETVIYPEIQDEITRGDSTKAVKAIDIAIEEVKTFLGRYDTVQMFGDKDLDYKAVFDNAYLTSMVKDIALWHLLKLANPSVIYESAKLLYDQAIDSLKRIQKGGSDPQWPFLDTTNEDAPLSDSVLSIQNTKRTTNF